MFNMSDRWRDFFVVDRRYFAHPNELSAERNKRRRAEGNIIKEAGYKLHTYFFYMNNDEAAKKSQFAAAEILRDEIERATGVKMEIAEGFEL